MNPPRSPNNDPDDAQPEPTERPPPHGRPEHPFEQLARQVGRAFARSAGKALARGAGEVLQSVVEDGDKVLEVADAVLDRVKDRIKTARGRRP